MYEFLTQNSLYVVLIVALTVWIGIAYYLFRLERAVSVLQQASSDHTSSVSQQ